MDWIAFLSYVFVTTFTPGPNNLTSATLGMNFGYKESLPFFMGVAVGVFSLILLSSVLIDQIYAYFPWIDQYLGIFGAIYILWLAYEIITSSPPQNTQEEDTKENMDKFGFFKALVLQYVNPKGVIYAVTLASTFILKIFSHISGLALIALALAFTAFVATSTWALLGSTFNRFLTKQLYGKIFNWIMGILLIYTALSVAGVFEFIL